MKNGTYVPPIVAHAQQVLDLWNEVLDLRYEVARLQKVEHDYHQLLDESLKHGEKMMGSWLSLLLSDRVKIAEPSNG